MRLGLSVSSPPFGSLFILFPVYTPLVSSFLSCPPVFMSGHLIRFFVCAHIGPGLSVYVHFYIHFKHRLQVAQVFTMRWGSSVVPVHLVSLSLQPHTFSSRLVLLLMSGSFCLCRAHIYTAVLALILFASPRGGVCVCVSTPVSKDTTLAFSFYLSIYLFLTAFFHLVQTQGARRPFT